MYKMLEFGSLVSSLVKSRNEARPLL